MKLSGSFCFRRICVVAALLCFPVISAPAWAQFETRATNPFPEGAYSIATGDFNHDGKLDVVMIVINGFAVALGNGDGTFQTAVTYTTQLSYSLAVADFNGDGNLDIVLANENENPSTVSVYLGNGDGTFRSPIDSSTGSSNQFVVVGDFNGDGKPDIAVASNLGISVLLGNGDGTFQAARTQTGFGFVTALAVGDFNNDHKLDLLVSGYSIGLLLGNGDGTLQPALITLVDYPTGGSIAAADLNGDGNMDAVLGYNFGGIAVFLGNGDGTFQPVVNYGTTGLSGGYLIVHDLNSDGKLDVAVPSGIGATPVVGVDVFWGNGDGTLQPARLYQSNFTGLPALGDVNGDGLPDFVLGSFHDGVVTMLNTGVVSFSFSAPVTFPAQLIYTKSAPQTVTLTNTGMSALSITSIRVSGQFKENNTCGKSVAAGAECNISILVQPTATGTLTGLITLVDSASSQPQYIELLGAGTPIKLAPTSLDFGTQKVGSKKSLPVTVTNEGSAAVTFLSIVVVGPEQGDFSVTSTCTAQALQPGTSCTATVTFDPTQTGSRGASVNFNLKKQIAANPVPLTLTGTGD